MCLACLPRLRLVKFVYRDMLSQAAVVWIIRKIRELVALGKWGDTVLWTSGSALTLRSGRAGASSSRCYFISCVVGLTSNLTPSCGRPARLEPRPPVTTLIRGEGSTDTVALSKTKRPKCP